VTVPGTLLPDDAAVQWVAIAHRTVIRGTRRCAEFLPAQARNSGQHRLDTPVEAVWTCRGL